jgi:hypothetical protein
MITINITKAIAVATTKVNAAVYQEVQHRTTKTAAGLANVLSDTDWATLLSTVRSEISTATTTAQLISAIDSLNTAIQANML